MPLRPTLRDIATETGYGKTTVSLALRNDPRIPIATREAIQRAAKTLGYRPDPILSQIASHRWRGAATSGSTLAFVTTIHPGTGKALDGAALTGARERAEDMGYRVEHFQFEDYRDAAHLARVIATRGIKGVIVGQAMRSDLCRDFPWQDFAAVACNTGFHRPPVNLVMPDHSHAVVEAWKIAIGRGYRRVGVALFDEGSVVDEFDKSAAALYCQQPHAVTDRVPLLYFRPGDSAAVHAWMKKHRPDVVLGFNDSVYWYLREHGHAIPGDVAFASLMREHEGAIPKPMSGMDYQPSLLGAASVEHLDTLLRANRYGIPDRVSIVMVQSKWIEGETLPGLAGKQKRTKRR